MIMKRLLLLAALSGLIGCSMHEEYTPPSPIELKPPHTKPAPITSEEVCDKFGDEGFEATEDVVDTENVVEKEQAQIQDDIATAERKKRAGKLNVAAKKNIKIERISAHEKRRALEEKEKTKKSMIEKIETSKEKEPAARKEIKKTSEIKTSEVKTSTQSAAPKENLDLDEIDDLED